MLHARVVAGSGGGPEKTILRSTAYAQDSGMHMATAYLHPHRDPGINAIQKCAAQHGTTLHTIPETGPVDPRALQQLLQLCRRERINVWHAHDYKTDVLGLLLKPLHPMKLVTTLHGYTWDTSRTKLYYRIDSAVLRGYDHVLSVSPLLTKHARDCGVPEQRITHVPNGIDLSEYPRKSDGSTVRKQYDLSPGDVVIGVVARHSQEKGVDRAIAALHGILQHHPNAKLLLIGDGPERDNLQQLAQALHIKHAVRFAGWQQDVKAFYPVMDVLLIPSLTEGLPNAALEAMAMRVPVASTRVGAVPELLEQGQAGVLLGDEADRWARQMHLLLANPSARQAIAAKAHQRVTEHYTMTQRMQRVFAVYDQLLGTRHAEALDNNATQRMAA